MAAGGPTSGGLEVNDSGLLLGGFAVYVFVLTICRVLDAFGPMACIAAGMAVLALCSATGFVISKRNS